MIQLNDFVRQWNDTKADAVSAFSHMGESGWYVLGSQVHQFEKALAEYWQLPYAAGVASGLDAIEISLRALGCSRGDKVLTTPVSAFATTLAILKLDAVPVYADVDKFGLLDLEVAREVLQNDPTIRYIVPVHLYGHALDMTKLKSLQDDFELIIVEDCAQSIGANFNGIATGSVGQMAATSFYPTKNLGAMGDGGAILTADKEYDSAARALRDYGQVSKYRHDVLGYNSRLDELQAALMLRVNLPRLDNWIARRRQIAAAYLDNIQSRAVRIPGSPPGAESSWHLFPVLIAPECKTSFLAFLKARGITAGEHYPIAIPDQRAVRTVKTEIAGAGIENARAFCHSEVSLPVHPYLTDGEVTAVINAINDWSA